MVKLLGTLKNELSKTTEAWRAFLQADARIFCSPDNSLEVQLDAIERNFIQLELLCQRLVRFSNELKGDDRHVCHTPTVYFMTKTLTSLRT